jgi:hypothetical protein
MFLEQRRRRGRPKGNSNDKVTVPIAVTQECYDHILHQQSQSDRHISATIMRLLREKNFRIIELQKKVDALLSERPPMQVTYESNPILVEVTNK